MRPGEQKALILAWILRQARIVMTDCSLPEETLKELYLESGSNIPGGPGSRIGEESKGKGYSDSGWIVDPSDFERINEHYGVPSPIE